MARRHVPERTCVACRTAGPKHGLIRIVRTVDGSLRIDSTGKLPGRGAYLCGRPGCWKAGLEKRALERALKVDLSADDRAALERYAAKLPDKAIPEGVAALSKGEEV